MAIKGSQLDYVEHGMYTGLTPKEATALKNVNTWVREHQLTSYFVLSYLLTWALWAPSLASARGLLPWQLPAYLSLAGNFGPALAAVLVAWVVDGGVGVKALLDRLMQWRVKSAWYIVALIPLGVNILLIAIFSSLSGLSPELGLRTWLTLVPTMLFWLIMGGPLTEEIGWRGFALPRLQENRSALSASLILALAWVGWHLPRYLDPSQAVGGLAAILAFALQATILCILFTWVYNNTAGSLLLPVLFHGAINTLGYLLPMLFPAAATNPDLGGHWVLVNLLLLGILAVWAAAVVIVNGPSTLSRKEMRDEETAA